MRIGERASEAGLFRIAEAEAPLTAPDRPARLDPALVTAAALGVFALWQLGKGRILPPALTLAFYAADIVRLLPQYEPPADTE